jgi:hypothetical protein
LSATNVVDVPTFRPGLDRSTRASADASTVCEVTVALDERAPAKARDPAREHHHQSSQDEGGRSPGALLIHEDHLGCQKHLHAADTPQGDAMLGASPRRIAAPRSEMSTSGRRLGVSCRKVAIRSRTAPTTIR